MTPQPNNHKWVVLGNTTQGMLAAATWRGVKMPSGW
jgi:hypothetical protein